ncbi:uncharacterized protein LOC125222886 [Salvia hispanica]|uniref:uncharacterized protein LOC125222886 n=1 Tax=Salvia hispanica TaxID=49212 RepID=UPI002009BF86|nr:uncharacterized protein LOC125222886 [Salvia hispanica]
MVICLSSTFSCPLLTAFYYSMLVGLPSIYPFCHKYQMNTVPLHCKNRKKNNTQIKILSTKTDCCLTNSNHTTNLFTSNKFSLSLSLSLSLMAVIKAPKKETSCNGSKQKKRQPPPPQSKQPSSWDQIKNLVTCKQMENAKIHHPCARICTFMDVAAADKSPEKVKRSSCGPPHGGAMQLRKLSGCYECRAMVDLPLPRANVFPCSQCGEIFPKIESLELHQAVRHAVSELSPDDSSRNIVEIIFKSSWLKMENPICKIERILKVHNTHRTIQRFEGYRDSIKLRAKRSARCAADGNELLRFHAATITCALGARGSSSLCGSAPACGICAIIRHGFRCNKTIGVCTTASSGRADDCLAVGGGGPRRAMLVCRVIAGRVKPRVEDDAPAGSYDSLAASNTAYPNMEELYVFSSRAILPCFVVIYNLQNA